MDVPTVIGGKMRVNTVNRGARGHRDRRDGCQHLTVDGVGQPLITNLYQVPVKW
jgi:hypothetical protein